MLKYCRAKSLLAGLLLSSALMTAPAQAQSKKELAAQNAALAQRVSVLESRLLTGDPAAERLIARMDSLESSQRNLTGEIERLAYERDNLKREVEALISDLRALQDLSTRMKVHLDAVDIIAQEQRERSTPLVYGDPSLGQPSAIPGAPTFREKDLIINDNNNAITEDLAGQSPQSVNAPANAAALGDIGKTRLAEGDFVGAQVALSQYLQFNPEASDAGEINYWLGESYFVRGGFADAASAYIESMKKDKQGEKAPNAMVRLAAALRELGDAGQACAVLASFPSEYPNASDIVKDRARAERERTGC